VAAFVVAMALVAGVVVTSQGGGGSPAPKGRVVAADRGEVAVTVGGIGHVNTLSGAAQLVVSAGAPGATAGGGAAGAGTSTGSAAPAAAPVSGGPTASSASGGTPAPADAVFPTAAGHVTHLLVRPHDHVSAGQPIATLADDGTTASNTLQARSDLETARLELAQKRIQDPIRGVPPTPAELQSGGTAVNAARAKLARVLAPPLPADVAAAKLDLAKALADARSARAGRQPSLAAAELAVATARHKLDLVTGAPDPAEVAAAQLELAKATVDQETLLQPAPPVAASALNAANLAITLAQQHLSDAQASGTPADVAAAQAELAKAQSERDALLAPAASPTAAARTAAQLAVDAARRRLDALLRPPAATVSAARGELAKSQADLAALRATQSQAGLGPARAGVTAAQRKLTQVLHPPTSDLVASARADVRKAQADLAVLRQRGAPANATDLALSRLKFHVAALRLALARDLERRLTVVAGSSGTVTTVLTTPGAAVDPSTPLVRVQDLGNLVVTLDLSEFDVGRTRIGAPARISADALGGRQFDGHVLDVASTGTDTGGVVNFPVTIALDAGSPLRPGMSVSARIVVASRHGVVRVPLAAVADRDAEPNVMVRDRTGALRRRPVDVGLAGGQSVEVRSGLKPGERVFVPGAGE
jgi:RND family efflux transporter MFP subunit